MAPEFIEPRPLPRGLDSRSLRRRGLQITVVLGFVGLVAALAPGLGEVRRGVRGRSRSPPYRLILFWLPLILGGAAFASLRKGLQHAQRLDLCDPSPHPQVAL